jgi:hypothetical protein
MAGGWNLEGTPRFIYPHKYFRTFSIIRSQSPTNLPREGNLKLCHELAHNPYCRINQSGCLAASLGVAKTRGLLSYCGRGIANNPMHGKETSHKANTVEAHLQNNDFGDVAFGLLNLSDHWHNSPPSALSK